MRGSMADFPSDYFQKIKFTPGQLAQYLRSAENDLHIAQHSNIPEVMFKFSYDAFIKLGITMIARQGYKVRSVVGHHVKIIEKFSQLLQNDDVAIFGNKMRKMRNIDFYDGGAFITERDSQEFLTFVQGVFRQVKSRA